MPDLCSEPVNVHYELESLSEERLGWCANEGLVAFPLDLKAVPRRQEDRLAHKDLAAGFD